MIILAGILINEDLIRGAWNILSDLLFLST